MSLFARSLFTSFILAIALAAAADTTSEDFSVEQDFSASAYDAAHWQTPVTTHNGNIYFTWVDQEMRTMIAKITPAGNVTTQVILQDSEPGKNHNLPSVAVDKKGYIHVAYNMHQSMQNSNEPGTTGWQYKVSTQPEDIRSFTFVGNTERTIPGQKITYPAFAKDNQGELYVTFRHRTHRDGKFGVDGSQGLGIAKYDAGSKRWRMLGGTDYLHGVKTFFWSNSSRNWGSKPIGYQGYRAKIFFDRSNRMHVSWDVFIEPGEEASHIMYAYSDDGGATFRKANGRAITSLPITPQNGDIVEQAPSGIFDTRTYVATTLEGRPIVSFEDRSERKSYFKTWNGTSWGARKRLPAGSPANFTVDRSGIMTAVQSGRLNRSWDGGTTWQSYSINNAAESTCLDDVHLRETGRVRFQSQVNGVLRLFTASFSGAGGIIPQPPVLRSAD